MHDRISNCDTNIVILHKISSNVLIKISRVKYYPSFIIKKGGGERNVIKNSRQTETETAVCIQVMLKIKYLISIFLFYCKQEIKTFFMCHK